MPESMTPLIILGVVGALFILLLSLLTNNYSLNNIKSKTVGDGQYGTARWATDQEIRKAYVTVPFDVASWRAGKKRPTVQGLVSAVCSAANGWRRWWIATMCIAS